MANIYYIRAAILEATGINLSLEETRQYLVEEGLLSPAKAKNIIFRGYAEFYDAGKEESEEETPDLVAILNSNIL